MAHDIERYLSIRSAGRPSFGPDGQLAFLMDTTGVSQVWGLTGPREWPQQLTFHTEPIAFASFSPVRDELVFGMDEGGNERWQLFRLAGGEEFDLTRHPDAIHQWGGWNHDGEQIAFTANRRAEDSFDGYIQHRDETGDDATLVFDGSEMGPLYIDGWSPDDERLLVHEFHSSREHDLYCLELSSGELLHLTDHDPPVRYASTAWGPDGETIYATTDRNADTLELATLDPDTGAFEMVDDGGDWNVSGVYTDHDSRTLARTRNVEGYSELSLFEIDSGGELRPRPTPDLPHGVLSGLSFGPDGERIAASVSTPTANTNTYVLGDDTAERWTDASTAGIPPATFAEPDLVRFDSFDGRSIPAFLTLPDSDGPFPVIVDIHGGPEAQRRPSFGSLRQYFVDNGYAMFEPNVRGSAGYGRAYMDLDNVEKRMDSVADIKAGVEWLTDHKEIDGSRVVALGGSYGGFMVLASLTEYPELWAAGVDIVGIANFVTFLENTGPWRQSHREAEYGSLDQNEFLEEISPINTIDAIQAPLFVLHGENDPRVPVDEAKQIVREASEHVPTEKLVFEDEGHGISKLDNRITAYQHIVEFLAEHV